MYIPYRGGVHTLIRGPPRPRKRRRTRASRGFSAEKDRRPRLCYTATGQYPVPTKERKAELVAQYGKDEKDSGSAAVQVALLTERIKGLTEHMKTHKKDFHTRRGLLMLVGKRRRLLSYIKSNDIEAYRTLIKSLGIRDNIQ